MPDLPEAISALVEKHGARDVIAALKAELNDCADWCFQQEQPVGGRAYQRATRQLQVCLDTAGQGWIR